MTGGQPVGLPLFCHFLSGLVFAFLFCFFFVGCSVFCFFSLRSSLFVRKFMLRFFGFSVFLLHIFFSSLLCFLLHTPFGGSLPLCFSVLFFLNVVIFYSFVHIYRSLCLFCFVFCFFVFLWLCLLCFWFCFFFFILCILFSFIFCFYLFSFLNQHKKQRQEKGISKRKEDRKPKKRKDRWRKTL